MATTVEHGLNVRMQREEFAALADLCEGLDDAAWGTPTCLPGWTVKDVLAHIVGTESMLAGEPAPDADISHVPYLRNDIARANELWVESMRPHPGTDVLGRFRAITARRLEALGSMTQEGFDAPSWTPAGPDETYGRFMRIRHFDCFLHEHDIRAALGEADRGDPDHIAYALEEPAVLLGYIVGKRAGMPSGTTVSVTVTGPLRCTWSVAVEERARLVDSLPGPPTVAIELSAMLFLRLTGGRADPLPYLGADVMIAGDHELGTQLATHLAYMI